MALSKEPSSRIILDASNVLQILESDEFSGDQEFIINISRSELEKIAEEVIMSNPELKALAEKNKEELQKWSEQIDARDVLYEQRAKQLADLEKELELLRIEYAAAYKSHAQTLKNRRSQSSQARKRISSGAKNDGDDDDVIVLDTKPSNTVLTKQLAPGQELYVGCGDVWKKGSLVEVVSLKEDKYQYRVRMGKTVPKIYAKSKIAFPNMPARSVRLGTRIIAKYFEGEEEFYPGIVAEPPYDGNKFRYLIFFDDGSALYQTKDNIRVVVEQRENQWEAMPTVLQDFIKHYIETYNRRRILRLTIGQQVKTEREGLWIMSECLKVDCSLVQMKFPTRNEPFNVEWIYRGSTRFLPLYKDQESLNKDKAVAKQKTTMRASGAGSRKAAITHHNTYNYKPPQPTQRSSLNYQQRIEAMRIKRDEHAGLRVRVNHPSMTSITYTSHVCSLQCLHVIRDVDLTIYKGKYMLTIPIYMGFQRHITRTRRTKNVYHSSKKLICYKAPCGRSLRTIQEVGEYLEATDCRLTIDMFSFEQALHLFEPFQASNVLVTINDISNGKENIPISCINALTHDLPDPLNYSGVRMPQKDVKLNTDPEFMVCCDCTDNCADKTKCACQQLTFEGYQILQPDIPLDKSGYNYRRLTENIVTGIYECNSKCRCKKTCFNRVVQNQLEQRLQIFKTEQRGWGIRCLDDIPLGSFICIYAGQLLSEEGADQGGRAYGDEYFAEIDFIEVGCDVKQSYEDGVVEESDDDDNKSDSEWEKSSESDGEGLQGQKSDIKPLRSKKNKPTDKEINDTPDKHNESDDKGEQTLMRSYFNESSPYVMDAKTSGNLGRYLNHSCNPNVFVQTVFVDTHDPRFPWISFFAKTFVRAGSELTWDYGYQPGLVEGKVMYCHCKSSNCRGRLL